MAGRPKRRRVVLTIEEKLKAIERLSKGETIQKVAEDLGVGKATVGEWKSKKEIFENWCARYSANDKSKFRKSTKDGNFEDVGRELYKWFMTRRHKNRPIESQVLKDKALELYRRLREDEERNGTEKKFLASDGWLCRWKTRHGVQLMSINDYSDEDFGNDRPKRARKPRARKTIREYPLDDDDDNNGTKASSNGSSIKRKRRANRAVSHRDAVGAFDTAILYLQQQGDAAANIEIALLRRLRDIAALKQSAAETAAATPKKSYVQEVEEAAGEEQVEEEHLEEEPLDEELLEEEHLDEELLERANLEEEYLEEERLEEEQMENEQLEEEHLDEELLKEAQLEEEQLFQMEETIVEERDLVDDTDNNSFDTYIEQ